jgi:hypothetical protein
LTAGTPSGRERTGARPAVGPVLAVCLLVGTLPGCADYKKLSRGGSFSDVVMHDILGQDRPPSDYYQYIRDSHSTGDFCYACGDDNFLVDKNIDAVQRLGDAQFGRLEGEAQVLELFTEVLLEDCSALARASAANSITKIAVKLPAYRYRPVPDDGSRLLSMMRELDRMHDPNGRLRACGPGANQRVAQLVTQIGNLKFDQYLNTRNAIKLFYDRRYLVDASDPALRSAIDTALVKRMRALSEEALTSAVDDREPSVRIEAIKGLKTLGYAGAAEIVDDRLRIESQWLVKSEALEYFGEVGTRIGVVALIQHLSDPNASVRFKARAGLVHVAREDYGARPEAWKHWAQGVDPSIDFGDDDDETSSEISSLFAN